MTDDDLDVAGVRYERVEPMRTWRLTADADAQVLELGSAPTTGPGLPGRVALDVTFAALTPAIGTDGQGRADRSDDSAVSTAATVGKGHLEQAGAWSGTITCDGDSWQLDAASARGNRDKSWGPRPGTSTEDGSGRTARPHRSATGTSPASWPTTA